MLLLNTPIMNNLRHVNGNFDVPSSTTVLGRAKNKKWDINIYIHHLGKLSSQNAHKITKNWQEMRLFK